MEAESSQENDSFKLINCCSKQAVEAACNTVLTSAFQQIDKSEYTDEFRENIKLRFKEIYENAVHDNVSVEGQTWSQAIEEGNTTKDYEPVNVELKKEIADKSLKLDELLVSTTRKRRLMPPKIAHEVSKRLKHQRQAVENFSPVLHKLETDAGNPPTKILEEESKQLQEAGETVGDLSRKTPKGKFTVALKISDAIAHIHSIKCTHSDIKPNNILIRKADNEPFVCDLGLAHGVSQTVFSQLTKGIRCSVLKYGPPEATDPREETSYAGDVWSLASTLLELLTRKHIWEEIKTDLQYVRRLDKDDVTPTIIQDIESSDISIVLRRCFCKDKDGRPNARELVDAFTAALEMIDD